MLQQKTIRTEITKPITKINNAKVGELEHVEPNEQKAPEKSPVQQGEKKAIREEKDKTI